MFRRKKRIRSMIANMRGDIFKVYGVLNPTDAQKMKASVYICIAGIAILNDVAGEGLRDVIASLVWETKELTKSLHMRVEELANDREEMEIILADFPDGVIGATAVNGLAAFDALYLTNVQRLVNDILRHTNDQWGVPGHAAIVVADGIFGKGKSKEHYLEVSMALLKFMKALGAWI